MTIQISIKHEGADGQPCAKVSVYDHTDRQKYVTKSTLIEPGESVTIGIRAGTGFFVDEESEHERAERIAEAEKAKVTE